MRALVFIHGIIGAQLELDGKKIWPPTGEEFFVTGYKRIKELLTETAIATGIIDRVYWGSFHRDFYKPVIDDLNVIAGRTNSLVEFVHYDWRLDNWSKGTEVLAHAIGQLEGRGVETIILICHSMGGLICRLMLEAGKYAGESWFQKIKEVFFVCTPHLGAARPLGFALPGAKDETDYAISKEDMVKLLSDGRYPAGYQCMPDKRRVAIYDVSQNPQVPQDIYLPEVDDKFGLAKNNISSLSRMRGLLAARPPHVKYVFVAGTGQKTSSAFYYRGQTFHSAGTTKFGDGTVVVSSAQPEQGPDDPDPMPGSHIGIFETGPFKTFLYASLGGGKPVIPMAEGQPRAVVSLQKDFARPGEELSVLIIPDDAATQINGKLTLSKITSRPEPSLGETLTVTDFSYAGTPITHLSSSLIAPTDSGAYKIEFEGSHRSGETGAAILVVR